MIVQQNQQTIQNYLLGKQQKENQGKKGIYRDGKYWLEASADFETTVLDSPEVYSWNICFEKEHQEYLPAPTQKWHFKEWKDKIFAYGINILDFMEFTSKLERSFNIVFHNFRSFDGHFILAAIFKLNYIEYSEDERRELFDKFNKPYDFKQMLKGEVKMFNDENAKLYYIQIRPHKSDHYIKFGGSEWLFAGSIKKFGVSLAKNHKDTDEAKERFHKKELKDAKGKAYQKTTYYSSIEELENDGNELEYMLQDSFILCEFRNMIHRNVLNRKHWEMTSAKTAMDVFMHIFGTKLLLIQMKKGVITEEKTERGLVKYKVLKNLVHIKASKKLFSRSYLQTQLIKQVFPIGWLEDESPYAKSLSNFEFINEMYYRGGLTLGNEKYVNTILVKGESYDGRKFHGAKVADITSSFPSSMMFRKMPWGMPIYGDTENKEYDLKFYQVIIKKDIKNMDGLPFIQPKGTENRLMPRNYLTKFKKGDMIYLQSCEYERFKEYYSPLKKNYSAKVMYSFKSKMGSEIFGDYIDYWFHIKDVAKHEGDEIKKYIAKLFLNALYGKFGTDINRETRKWDWESGYWGKIEPVKSKVKYYLPVATSITAESRMRLVDGCGHNFENYIGGDTDSAIWWVDEKGELLGFNGKIGEKLGEWEIETDYEYEEVIFRRAKQYGLFNQTLGKKKVRYAGLNLEALDEDDHVQLDDVEPWDLIVGKAITGQLKPKRLPTGILLEDIVKSITPCWNFKPRLEQKIITEDDVRKVNRKYKLK